MCRIGLAYSNGWDCYPVTGSYEPATTMQTRAAAGQGTTNQPQPIPAHHHCFPEMSGSACRVLSREVGFYSLYRVTLRDN